MAYIYRRGKKWAYRAYAGKDPITGKDKQKSKSGFLTKKDAQLAAAIFERQFHKGDYIEPSALTMKSVCDEWLKHYSVDVKQSSINTRKIALKHIKANFGDDPIQKITKMDYQSFIDDMSEKVSNNFVRGIHTTSKLIFEYAKEMKLINSVPTENIRIPKQKKTIEDIEDVEDRFLEKDELEKFLLAAKTNGLDGDLLTFTTLAYTGLRVGELLALKWDDIDFQECTLRVSKTYYNLSSKKKDYLLHTPKTENSIRTISIDPVVVDLMKEYKLEQDKLKQDNAPFYNDNGFIFTTNDGYPKKLNLISSRLKRLLKIAGIKKNITSHSFRHTHTSLLIEANVHIKEIQERLGHSDISTTMDIYAHITKDIKKEASTKFSSLMGDLSNSIQDKT